MLNLADRINRLTESQTIAMARLSRELQEQGHDVISLSLGEPDFQTPDAIREGAKQAIDDGFTKYTPISGFTDLRQAISDKFQRENNLNYSLNQIVVSTGAKQSIANVVLSLVNPGDEVLLPSPYWVSYEQIIKLAEGVPVFIESTVESDYKIQPQAIKDAITDKTKLIIYSSPCNPSGSVYTKEELKSIADVLADYQSIYIISDEIYEHINFIGHHESIAQFKNIHERVIVVNGVSKCFAMTGWRVGYIGAPEWIAKACDKMQGQFTSGTCSIAQKAATTALNTGTDFFKIMRETYLRRRNLLINLMKEIPGIKVNTPGGSFYLFPDVSSYFGKKSGVLTINNANDLSMYLLNDAKVSVVTGEAFGTKNCIRISYATSDEILIEAMTRIQHSLSKLK